MIEIEKVNYDRERGTEYYDIKLFYKQKIFKTLLKEFILAFIYSLLLAVTLIGSAYLAYINI